MERYFLNPNFMDKADWLKRHGELHDIIEPAKAEEFFNQCIQDRKIPVVWCEYSAFETAEICIDAHVLERVLKFEGPKLLYAVPARKAIATCPKVALALPRDVVLSLSGR